MEIYYPLYYKEFRCLADKCPNSCCVGWEIGIDEDIMQKYDSLTEPQKSDICKHIHDGAIKLTCDGRCPFLDSEGLCKIISSLGDEYISEICREHPRFYNRIAGRNECGIGASCPEACRLILMQDDYCQFTLSHVSEEKIGVETDFDTIKYRNTIYSVLSDRSIGYSDRKERVKSEFVIPELSFEDKKRLLSELEYLEIEHKGAFSVGKSALGELEIYCERFLAYLIFRHVSVATSYENLRARLGFCLLLCELLENFCSQGTGFAEIVDFARVISEEIEYSQDNCDAIIFEFECLLN